MATKEKKLVSSEQIKQWKAEYGHVYRTEVDGETIIWRRLRRKEYEQISLDTIGEEDTERARTERMYRRQELIAKAVILFPEDPTEFLEGTIFGATNIAEEVMKHSGFEASDTEEL